MDIQPLTAEPHFWAKEVLLPVALTIATASALRFSRVVLNIAKSGYRKAMLQKSEEALRFAKRLHGEPHVAQAYLIAQVGLSAMPIALCVIGSAFFVIGLVGSSALPEELAYLLGAVSIGASSSLLAGNLFDILFALKAVSMFEKLELRIQRRLDRLRQ